MMPCKVPIMRLSPSKSNIRKKRMDHGTDAGMNDMASMKDRNRKLVPSLICKGEKRQELKCP